MKKTILTLLAVISTAFVFSQASFYDAYRLKARDAFQLGNKTITSISEDTAMANKSASKLITEMAFKNLLQARLNNYATSTPLASKLPFYNTLGNITGVTELHWDNVNKRLGIKKNDPLYSLDVAGNVRVDGGYFYVKNGHVVLKTDSLFTVAPEQVYYGKRQTWRHGIDVANNGGTCDYVMLADDLPGFGVRDLIYVNRNKEGTNLIDDSTGYPSIAFWATPASGRWISNGVFNPVATQSLFNTPDIRPNRNTLGIRKSAYTTNNKMLAFYGSEDEVADLWVNNNFEAGPFWKVKGDLTVLSSDINNTNSLSLAANPSDSSSNFWIKNYYSGLTGYQLRFRSGNKDFLKYSKNTDYTTFTGTLESNSFYKTGGNASQFLKADGTVDANTYLTTANAASTYLAKTGGTATGLIRIQKSYSLAQNAFEIHFSDGNNYSLGIENYLKGGGSIGYKFNVLNTATTVTPMILASDGVTVTSLNKTGSNANEFLMGDGSIKKVGYSGVTLASGATYTATLTDEIILANAGTTTNIYLPDVTTCTGKVYEIAFYNVATASVSISINANGTQTFDTYPSQTYLNHSYTFGVGIMNTKIVSTGSKWAVLQASIGGF